MHLGRHVPIYLYLPNMILSLMKIGNSLFFKKLSVKALKTAKNASPEICTFKLQQFRVL